ncbi:hypothetical protein K458DRAFT_444992 [Lentithecium fluviatile CBS 122367]|uniref:Uncharacterized protein n=1 Tax=Lentithecium fluviatile CBS 122367 TaxID=1168545 RepID=A0A6G1IS26_9PLEO|nr:hypothetical protein K458DRAFT_444992 [Lentithecium fluviatile CBS 122367]
MCTCLPIAVVTTVRCRLSWHFILIGLWKLITSISLAGITIHRCFLMRQEVKRPVPPPQKKSLRKLVLDKIMRTPLNPDRHQSQVEAQPHLFQKEPRTVKNKPSPLWWLVVYLVGSVIGMVGLGSLLYESFRSNPTVRDLTIGFAILAATIPALVTSYLWQHARHRKLGPGEVLLGGAVAFGVAFGFFSALYSDLVLGTIADNMSGLPSSDFSWLYWAWFFFKRVPMMAV